MQQVGAPSQHLLVLQGLLEQGRLRQLPQLHPNEPGLGQGDQAAAHQVPSHGPALEPGEALLPAALDHLLQRLGQGCGKLLRQGQVLYAAPGQRRLAKAQHSHAGRVCVGHDSIRGQRHEGPGGMRGVLL